MTPPLAGRTADILTLFQAGRRIPDVVEIGRYRRSWTEAHVQEVVAQWLRPRPAERKPRPHNAGRRSGIEHGTDKGYRKHKNYGEDACAECKAAHSRSTTAYKQKRKSS